MVLRFLAGSADFSVGAVCYVYGCMDTLAVNYDAAATADDGSCSYACTAAPYCENFDLGTGTWTNNGWINDGGQLVLLEQVLLMILQVVDSTCTMKLQVLLLLPFL